MGTEVIDIIHNITYQVQDQELSHATRTVEGNIAGIENLTKRQIRLAKQYNDTVAQDVDKRQRLNRMIKQNSAALDHHKKSLENNLLNNKALNRAMEQELGIIGTLERKLKILQQARRTATSTSEIRRYDGLIAEQQNRLNRINNVPQPRGGFMGNLSGIGSVARLLPAIGGAISLANVGSQIKEVTQKFESYRTTLRNTFQSSIRANEEFQKIKEFAEKTPYSVDELTASFVKLVNRGFVPTKEELTNMGDLAASQGKSFDQLTEAILDAQTGEFERLKEFGIRAKTTGDNVTLSFKGIERQVKKTDEQALRRAVITFGQLQGVAGGMSAQATTLQGKISNLGDSFDSLFSSIGDRGAGVFGSLIDGAKELVDWFGKIIKQSPADSFREQQTELNSLVNQLIIANDQEGVRSSLMSEISAKYPEFLNLIDAEKSSVEQLSSALGVLNQQYENKIRIALIDEKQNSITEKQTNLIRKQREAIEKLVPVLEKYGYTELQFAGLSQAEQKRVGAEILKKEAQSSLNDAQTQISSSTSEFAGMRDIEKVREFGDAAKNFEEFEKINTELNNQRIKNIQLSNAQHESYISGLKETLKLEEEELKVLKESGANQKEIDAQIKLIQGIKDIINPPNPSKTTTSTSSSSSKSKGTKSDPNKDALKGLDDLMKAEQEKLKQKFEEDRALLLDALSKGIIDREIYNNRLTSLTEKHNIDLLNVESKFANQRTKFLKGAEKEANTTRIAEIKNSINETIQAIKERSEKEIAALLSSQKEIDAELFQMLADSEQKEIETINRNTQSKLYAYQKQYDELLTKQRIALAELNTENSDAAEKQLKIIEESQQKIEDARLKVIENGERAIRDVRLKYALQEIKELETLANQRLDSYTEAEQNRFDQEHQKLLEENDQKLSALRDSNAEYINEQELSNREKRKLEEKRSKDSQEIAVRSEIAKQYILKTSIENQLAILRAGFDQLTDQEKEGRQKQIDALNAQLGATNTNISNSFTKLNEITDGGKNSLSEWSTMFQDISNAAVMAAETIVSSLQAAVESEIRIREGRVERARLIAERGNAELLQMEEERLRKAQAQQERYARSQIAINAAQQVSASMLAIANAASAGYGWASIPLVLAVIGALASGFSMVKSMTSDSMPGFKDGVVGLEGPGTSKSDSIPAKLSRGESVVTAEGTNAGDNAEILRMMNQGVGFRLPDANGNIPHSPNGSNKEFSELKNEVVALRHAVENQKGSEVSFDEDGIFVVANRVNVRKRKRDKL